ncbi:MULTISPECIES: hypothetical protein [Burkholderia cepacia complex]|uniref:hypothetical protein n=1 Tax=Burkholderia cepacia complex TaxID=87882 RepID=UPI001CF596D8|nr:MULTISPECIES: hypothetical protein [Burkholderia cepacia complex]MCA8318578.1 hypothetical protein [Burkholderia cepacia]
MLTIPSWPTGSALGVAERFSSAAYTEGSEATDFLVHCKHTAAKFLDRALAVGIALRVPCPVSMQQSRFTSKCATSIRKTNSTNKGGRNAAMLHRFR